MMAAIYSTTLIVMLRWHVLLLSSVTAVAYITLLHTAKRAARVTLKRVTVCLALCILFLKRLLCRLLFSLYLFETRVA